MSRGKSGVGICAIASGSAGELASFVGFCEAELKGKWVCCARRAGVLSGDAYQAGLDLQISSLFPPGNVRRGHNAVKARAERGADRSKGVRILRKGSPDPDQGRTSAWSIIL